MKLLHQEHFTNGKMESKTTNIQNFRDVAKFNPNFKEGFLFRSATLTNYQTESFLKEFLRDNGIQTIIDLRADREVEADHYHQKNFQYIQAPFDPWNQSADFQKNYNKGSNVEIAYHFFMLECKASIKQVINSILEAKESVLIHCHAGKDRTGIIIALLAMLLETPKDLILKDYLASEMDTTKEYLEIVFKVVEQESGIVNYLKSCNLSVQDIEKVKKKICKT